MELWIRSQNKKKLYNVKNLELDNLETGICYESRDNFVLLGKYKSKERALEVLDEIQKKIKTLLYLKSKTILKPDTIESAKKYYEELNGVDFITCDHNFEIEPITTNVIFYEMPKE